MKTNQQKTPPTGYQLVIDVPDYGPDVFESDDVEVYESEHLTKDGSVEVYGSWTATDGLEIVIAQDGEEITLPSGWAARQLAELLYRVAGDATV